MKNDTLRPIEKSPMTNMNLQSFSTLSAIPQYSMERIFKFTFQALICVADSDNTLITICGTSHY